MLVSSLELGEKDALCAPRTVLIQLNTALGVSRPTHPYQLNPIESLSFPALATPLPLPPTPYSSRLRLTRLALQLPRHLHPLK